MKWKQYYSEEKKFMYGFGELIDIERENLELMNILIKKGNESL